jgi:predicted amidophosphoribosyltransferase
VPAAHEATRTERWLRLRGAFAGNPARLRGSRVILVDDVMTTGATLRQATRACLSAGAVEVVAVALARVPSP